MQPYIGVTGVMNKEEAVVLANAVPEKSNRLVMRGVLASSKTINGIPNKWPNRYPKPENLGSIFSPDARALDLVHYNTKEPETLCAQMERILELAGPYCQGFQLNMAWPDPRALEKFSGDAFSPIIVLQVGNRAFEMIEHSPEKLADKLVTEYNGLVNYILLDPSGGLGKPFDPELAKAYLYAVESKGFAWGLGVAGGLSPSTLDLLCLLVTEFPNLSIDAEGKLRDKDDRLDLNIATEYIRKAFEMFNKNAQSGS